MKYVNQITNKELLLYCKVFYDYFLPVFLSEGKYPRINLYTKENGYTIMSLYAISDKSAQGVVIYEGNQVIDEPTERVEITHSSYYIARPATQENWTNEAAKRDLSKALVDMGR